MNYYFKILLIFSISLNIPLSSHSISSSNIHKDCHYNIDHLVKKKLVYILKTPIFKKSNQEVEQGGYIYKKYNYFCSSTIFIGERITVEIEFNEPPVALYHSHRKSNNKEENIKNEWLSEHDRKAWKEINKKLTDNDKESAIMYLLTPSNKIIKWNVNSNFFGDVVDH
jgi:hypothetical protein